MAHRYGRRTRKLRGVSAHNRSFILRLSCPDAVGIVAAVTHELAEHNALITKTQHYRGFKGAKPYHQAYARGVKLIGATAHYVNGDLDEGPSIEQAVERVDHSMTVEQWTTLGNEIESVMLLRAIQWHAASPIRVRQLNRGAAVTRMSAKEDGNQYTRTARSRILRHQRSAHIQYLRGYHRLWQRANQLVPLGVQRVTERLQKLHGLDVTR